MFFWRLLCKLSGRSNNSWGTVGSKLIGSAKRVTLLAGQVMEAGPRVLSGAGGNAGVITW